LVAEYLSDTKNLRQVFKHSRRISQPTDNTKFLVGSQGRVLNLSWSHHTRRTKNKLVPTGILFIILIRIARETPALVPIKYKTPPSIYLEVTKNLQFGSWMKVGNAKISNLHN
jgi:hypothetical protein